MQPTWPIRDNWIIRPLVYSFRGPSGFRDDDGCDLCRFLVTGIIFFFSNTACTVTARNKLTSATILQERGHAVVGGKMLDMYCLFVCLSVCLSVCMYVCMRRIYSCNVCNNVLMELFRLTEL